MADQTYHILYHHRTLSKDGQNVHIEEMLKAFKDQGHSVTLVGPTPNKPDTPKGKKNEQDHPAFKSRLFHMMKKLLPSFIYELLEYGYNLKAYRRLCAAIDHQKPDFVYERYNLFMLAGVWAAKKYNLPLILEVNAPLADERKNHGQLSLYRFAKNIEQQTWQSASALITVSDVLADKIRTTGVSPEKIHVMHNGIDPDKFNKKNTDTGQLVQWYNLFGKTILGFTGYARPWHKLDEVIRLIALLKNDHNLHLLAVGDGPAVNDCLKLAADLGIQDRVTFTGPVPRENIASYVNCFDIALQPAVTDYASPLKLFEYMALGKAIIAPDQPNIREILTDHHDSLLFQPSSDDSFRQAIETLLADPALRHRLSENAEKTLSEKSFFWSTNAARTLEIAENLLGKPE